MLTFIQFCSPHLDIELKKWYYSRVCVNFAEIYYGGRSYSYVDNKEKNTGVECAKGE